MPFSVLFIKLEQNLLLGSNADRVLAAGDRSRRSIVTCVRLCVVGLVHIEGRQVGAVLIEPGVLLISDQSRTGAGAVFLNTAAGDVQVKRQRYGCRQSVFF